LSSRCRLARGDGGFPLLSAFGADIANNRGPDIFELMADSNEFDANDEWQMRLGNAVYAFATALKELHESNPWPETHPLLPWAMNSLMTELWDRCFSQTQIREAFNDAVADMPRYASGHEVRP
jgi:hypothetical protein